jgi:hypothetical protein
MKYVLLLLGDESGWENLSEEESQAEMEAEMAAYQEYDRELSEAGVFVAGEGLQPTSTATTMRIVGGERVLTDGPFAETKEQLGGFYVLDCKDLDGALGWAERCPASKRGSIEIRPVIDYEAMGYEQPQGSEEASR